MAEAQRDIRQLAGVFSDVGALAVQEAIRSTVKHGDQAHLPDGTGSHTYPLEVMDDRERLHFDHYAQELAARATRDTEAHSQNEGGDGSISWWHILREEVLEAAAESDTEKLHAELIQVAAVAIKWAEAIERRAVNRG